MNSDNDLGDKDRLMDHVYDGKKKHNNPIPGWWKWIFIGTIVFAVFCGVYWHMGGPGLTMHEEYQQQADEHFAALAKAGKQLKVTEQMLAGAAANRELVVSTKQLFLAKCAQCHGLMGEGKIGPNLTDDHWLHGGKLMAIYRVIDQGVPTKGMMAWGRLLKQGEMVNLTAYVAALQGTNPPQAKPPQGNKLTR